MLVVLVGRDADGQIGWPATFQPNLHGTLASTIRVIAGISHSSAWHNSLRANSRAGGGGRARVALLRSIMVTSLRPPLTQYPSRETRAHPPKSTDVTAHARQAHPSYSWPCSQTTRLLPPTPVSLSHTVYLCTASTAIRRPVDVHRPESYPAMALSASSRALPTLNAQGAVCADGAGTRLSQSRG